MTDRVRIRIKLPMDLMVFATTLGAISDRFTNAQWVIDEGTTDVFVIEADRPDGSAGELPIIDGCELWDGTVFA